MSALRSLEIDGSGLAWQDLESTIFSVLIGRVFIHHGIHDPVVDVPIQFSLVFRGDEGAFKCHRVPRFAVGPGVAASGISTPLESKRNCVENTHT